MYDKYKCFVKNINEESLLTSKFKSNEEYKGILEHVSFEQGDLYLKLIKNEFTYISYVDIINFVNINDNIGEPNVNIFDFGDNKTIKSSPTSLRYIYHSLLILEKFKSSNLSSIVEIGCGYGGLFLAICYFSNLLKIEIKNYYLIDFSEVCKLIDNYLKVNEKYINVKYKTHSSSDYGKDISEENLFLISNYCLTEISSEHREQYISGVFKKVKNGFIIWQTVFGLSIDSVNIIKKEIIEITEERPQTSSEKTKNYFVNF